MKWFQPTQPEPDPTPERVTVPVDYPSGVAVDTLSGLYFIKGKVKFKVFSDRVAESWRFIQLPGTEESLSKFKLAGTLGFRDGTIIQNIANNKIYLISDIKRRQILNPDVFSRFGFNTDDIVWASEAETNLHEEGEVLS